MVARAERWVDYRDWLCDDLSRLCAVLAGQFWTGDSRVAGIGCADSSKLTHFATLVIGDRLTDF